LAKKQNAGLLLSSPKRAEPTDMVPNLWETEVWNMAFRGALRGLVRSRRVGAPAALCGAAAHRNQVSDCGW
jgi:hypothetical protein